MKTVYDMTPDIPATVKRFATLENKYEDYDRWMPAYEGIYVHLKKWLEENEYEMLGRDEENDRRFLIKDLAKDRVGYIEYWPGTDTKWEFWMVLE